jgi:hypothetical protein
MRRNALSADSRKRAALVAILSALSAWAVTAAPCTSARCALRRRSTATAATLCRRRSALRRGRSALGLRCRAWRRRCSTSLARRCLPPLRCASAFSRRGLPLPGCAATFTRGPLWLHGTLLALLLPRLGLLLSLLSCATTFGRSLLLLRLSLPLGLPWLRLLQRLTLALRLLRLSRLLAPLSCATTFGRSLLLLRLCLLLGLSRLRLLLRLALPVLAQISTRLGMAGDFRGPALPSRHGVDSLRCGFDLRLPVSQPRLART